MKEHNWIDYKDAFYWPKYGDPSMAKAYKKCKNCGIKFKHNYHNESFSSAMKRQNISQSCINSL